MVKLLADHGLAAYGAFRVGHGLKGGPTPLSLNATSTVYGMVGQPLSYVPFGGGVAPVTSEHTSPALPDGITFSGGVYSGTPTGAAVTGSITGSATDADLNQVNWSTVTFNVADALQISHSAPASVVEDAAYDSGSFSVTGGHSPLELEFLNLPAGLAPVGDSIQGSIADAGSYSYDVRVTDAQGFQETITVNLEVTANQAPVAVTDAPTTPFETSITINVKGNDTDPENDALDVISVTQPASGGTTVLNPDDTVTFTPATGFSGLASFTYTVRDTAGNETIGTVNVTVQADTGGAFSVSYGWDENIDLGTVGTLFVDAARPDDSGDGASLPTAKKTIQAAVDLAAPGDTIKIRGGTYEEAVNLTGVLGTSVSPIAIERYGAERPVISGQSALTGWQPCVSADSAILGAQWVNCFKIENVQLVNLAASNPLSINLHENGQRLYVATDREDMSDLFWVSWVESYHGYSDPTGISFALDGDGHVVGVTHAAVLGQYTEAQLLEAYVRYYSSGNSTDIAPVTAFNGTDTVTVTGPREPQAGDYRYSLENIGPAIAAGQFAFIDNGDGTIDVFVYPVAATTAAELDASITYASRSVGVDISNASYLELRGLEAFGQAGDGLDNGCGFATQTASTASKTDITLEHCFAHGNVATNGSGYGAFYLSGITNLTVLNCEAQETQGAYGFFFSGLGTSPGLRHAFCKAQRTNNAPYRNFGVHEGVSAFNYAVDCGLDTHANKGNTYDDCNHVVVWGYNYDRCRGFYALQRASNITLAFNQIPSLPRDETGNGTPRGIQVQNKDPIPFPSDPTRFFNNIVLPEIPVGTGVAISFDNAFNIEPLFGFNNVTHGITTDVGDNGSAYDPPITPAPITTDYNVVTALAPSQTEANLGANSVYEADLDEVVADHFSLDYTPPAGSPILTTPGRDMTPEIDALKAKFPDVAHFFDHDMNGHPIDWSVPFVGHDASLAFTHSAPAKVIGLALTVGDSEMVLDWTAPADNGLAISDYIIQRSADGGVTWFTIPHAALTDVTFTDSGLTNGSDYVWRVAAMNSGGHGPWSDRVTGTPVSAANIVLRDTYQTDLANFSPRRGGEVITSDPVKGRIVVTSPDGVASFSGYVRSATVPTGVDLQVTVTVENINNTVAIHGEFGTPSNIDAYVEWGAGEPLVEDGLWTWVSPVFQATQPELDYQLYNRGGQPVDAVFEVVEVRIEQV